MTKISVALATAALALLCTFGIQSSLPQSHAADKAAGDNAGQQAVEPDMHEFMEYVFQPAYKRLKPAMAEEPKTGAEWKPVKAEGLVLAEAGNLLFLRLPDKGADDWKKFSVAVRNHGKSLYQAGKKRDFAAASKSYRAMLVQCNACHKQFADGKHQLAP